MVWHFEKCIVCGRVFLTMKKGQYHCSLACKEKNAVKRFSEKWRQDKNAENQIQRKG